MPADPPDGRDEMQRRINDELRNWKPNARDQELATLRAEVERQTHALTVAKAALADDASKAIKLTASSLISHVLEHSTELAQEKQDDRAALVEKVARLMCEQRGQHPDSVCYRLKIDGGHETIRRWMNYTNDATALLSLIRAEVLEEAARVADATKAFDDNLQQSAGCWTTGQRVAAAIRGLKGDT